MENTKKPVITVDHVYKSFELANGKVDIIKDMHFDILEGEFVIIYGPSGCGKSTLLNLMNGWEDPTSGEVRMMGEKLIDKTEDQRAQLRKGLVALVHQSANWVKAINTIDNIVMPYLLAGKSKEDGVKRGMALLRLLNLEKYAHYKPMDLSGGQQQRISMLRALVNNPKILMADEPTGNLDTSSTVVMMDLFEKINVELGRTVIMVTHNLELLKYADRTINIIDGRLVEMKQFDRKVKRPEKIKNDILDIVMDRLGAVRDITSSEDSATDNPAPVAEPVSKKPDNTKARVGQ